MKVFVLLNATKINNVICLRSEKRFLIIKETNNSNEYIHYSFIRKSDIEKLETCIKKYYINTFCLSKSRFLRISLWEESQDRKIFLQILSEFLKVCKDDFFNLYNEIIEENITIKCNFLRKLFYIPENLFFSKTLKELIEIELKRTNESKFMEFISRAIIQHNLKNILSKEKIFYIGIELKDIEGNTPIFLLNEFESEIKIMPRKINTYRVYFIPPIKNNNFEIDLDFNC